MTLYILPLRMSCKDWKGFENLEQWGQTQTENVLGILATVTFQCSFVLMCSQNLVQTRITEYAANELNLFLSVLRHVVLQDGSKKCNSSLHHHLVSH